MEILGYLASILMGLSLGMIGGGGSILTVPILVYLFGIDPIIATTYSLAIVGSTAFIGGLSYLKNKNVDLKIGFIFAIPSFIGVYLTRAYLLPQIPNTIFQINNYSVTKSLLIMMLFALLMVAASFSMIKSKTEAQQKTKLSSRQKYTLIVFEGLIIGGLTGLVGAGGGFLIIPALVVLVGMPMKIAIGTSLFIISAKSLVGLIGDLQQQTQLNWIFLAILTSIAIAGLILGLKLSKKISENKLKKIFGYFVLIVGIIILFDQIRRF